MLNEWLWIKALIYMHAGCCILACVQEVWFNPPVQHILSIMVICSIVRNRALVSYLQKDDCWVLIVRYGNWPECIQQNSVNGLLKLSSKYDLSKLFLGFNPRHAVPKISRQQKLFFLCFSWKHDLALHSNCLKKNVAKCRQQILKFSRSRVKSQYTCTFQNIK